MTKAKTRSKAPAVPAPQNRADVDEAIYDIGRMKRELVYCDAMLGDKSAELKAIYEKQAAPFKTKLKALEKAVQTWCEAHKDELTGGGKRRSFKFAAGLVRWRLTPAKVTVRGAANIVKLLRRRRDGARYLRTKVEIDKEALLNHPDYAAAIPGITIAGGEQFEIEPFDAKLDGEAG